MSRYELIPLWLDGAPGFQALVDSFLGCSWCQAIANQVQLDSERFNLRGKLVKRPVGTGEHQRIDVF